MFKLTQKKKLVGILTLSLILVLLGGEYWLLTWLLLLPVIILEAVFSKSRHQKSNRTLLMISSGFMLGALILIRIFLVDYYLIPSNSMSPCLLPEDRILVSKMAYGPRLPASLLEVPMINFICKLLVKKEQHKRPDIASCKRLPGYQQRLAYQDIVVFNHPKTRQINVKRCMGLPGDNWPIDGVDSLVIPGKGIGIKLNAKNFPHYQYLIEQFEQQNIYLKDGFIFLDGKPVEEYTFTQDYYFMLGDNQQESVDSRHWGLLPHAMIIGKTKTIVYAKNNINDFWNRFLKKIGPQ